MRGPCAVGVALEQGFVILQRHIDVCRVAGDQVLILVDDLFALAGVAALEPFLHALAVVRGGVRRGLLAAQEQGDGVGARLAEGAAAEFGNGDDVEILDQDFAGADVGAATIGQDAGRQDDRGHAVGAQQLLGALDEKGLDAVGGFEIVDGLGEGEGLAFFLGQRFQKAAHAIRRVGDQQVKAPVLDVRKRLVLVD